MQQPKILKMLSRAFCQLIAANYLLTSHNMAAHEGLQSCHNVFVHNILFNKSKNKNLVATVAG